MNRYPRCPTSRTHRESVAPASGPRTPRSARHSQVSRAPFVIFCRVTNQGKLHGSYPPEPPRSPRASPSVPRLIQPKVSKTKKTCSSIYRGVRQRPWGRYARHRRSNRIATPLPALLFTSNKYLKLTSPPNPRYLTQQLGGRDQGPEPRRQAVARNLRHRGGGGAGVRRRREAHPRSKRPDKLLAGARRGAAAVRPSRPARRARPR